jgi:hypothetical protein
MPGANWITGCDDVGSWAGGGAQPGGSGTSWTAGGDNGDWFDGGGSFGCAGNWSNGVPVLSSTGTLSVTVSGAICAQPFISAWECGAPGTFFVEAYGFAGGNALTEIQIGGQSITLTGGRI